MTEATIVASALPERRRVAALAALALAALGPVYFGVDAAGLVGAVFLAALAVLTVKDLEDRRIPNAIVLPVAGIVLVATALLHPGRAAESILAALAAGAFLLIPSLSSRGVGVGDVKLAFLLGAALGRGVVPALLLASIAAAATGLVLLVKQGPSARKTVLPFAPFLTLGAVGALALGAPHVL